MINLNRIYQEDNFFLDPEYVRDLALSQKFRGPESFENWRGVRTSDIGDLAYHDITFKQYILNKTSLYDKDIARYLEFKDKGYQLNITCFFHMAPKLNFVEYSDGRLFEDAAKHIDPSNLAGVVYLTPNPPENSGTSFFYPHDIKVYQSENKFNRMVFYPGSYTHGPTDNFGTTPQDARLTLTFFIY